MCVGTKGSYDLGHNHSQVILPIYVSLVGEHNTVVKAYKKPRKMLTTQIIESWLLLQSNDDLEYSESNSLLKS